MAGVVVAAVAAWAVVVVVVGGLTGAGAFGAPYGAVGPQPW